MLSHCYYLSALFTQENRNCDVTCKAQSTENNYKFRKGPKTFRKDRKPQEHCLDLRQVHVDLSPKFLTCCVKGTQIAMRTKKDCFLEGQ